MSIYVYSDGGQSAKNPCTIGGAWAFRIVDHAEVPPGGSGDGGPFGPRDNDRDLVLLERCKPITPADLQRDVVTNNNAELFGLCQAIYFTAKYYEDKPTPADGVTFCPDNRFAMRCVKRECSPDSEPPIILKMLRKVWELLDTMPFPVQWELIAGHPERGLVIDGIKHKGDAEPYRLYRVSAHNAACDALCTTAALELKDAVCPPKPKPAPVPKPEPPRRKTLAELAALASAANPATASATPYQPPEPGAAGLFADAETDRVTIQKPEKTRRKANKKII